MEVRPWPKVRSAQLSSWLCPPSPEAATEEATELANPSKPELLADPLTLPPAWLYNLENSVSTTSLQFLCFQLQGQHTVELITNWRKQLALIRQSEGCHIKLPLN